MELLEKASGSNKPGVPLELAAELYGDGSVYGLNAKARPKSTVRITYEAEATLIKRKLGDLKAIRHTLGISQKKFCQLLMVNPSAFTRWTQEGNDAPPHIYRSLQWYLALQEKYPALDVDFWLGTRTKSIDELRDELQDYQMQAEARLNDLFTEREKLEKKVSRLRAWVAFGSGTAVLLLALSAIAYLTHL